MKWKYIKDTIIRDEIDMVCIQETKLNIVETEKCFGVWESNNVEWRMVIGKNRAGIS